MVRAMSRRVAGLVLGLVALGPGCGSDGSGVAQRCDQQTPCMDPERPFCDIGGVYGRAGTCVAEPEVVPDAAPTCTTSAECSAEVPICDGDCRVCQTDAECESRDPQTPSCKDGVCFACREHGECETGVCNRDTGACVTASDIIYAQEGGSEEQACGTEANPCRFLNHALGQVDGERQWVLVRGTIAGPALLDTGTVRIIGDASWPQPAVVTGSVALPPSPALAVRSGASMTVEGVEVRGGFGTLCQDASLSLLDAVVREMVSLAIATYDCDLRIERSRVSQNDGGGVRAEDSAFRIVNTVIDGNGSQNSKVGGVTLRGEPGDAAVFAFNTVVNNVGNDNYGENEYGGTAGVVCDLSQAIGVDNNIVYGNEDDVDYDPINPADEVTGNCDWRYSLIEGDTPGQGNLNVDPEVSADGFHLMPGSPAIDAGTVLASLDLSLDVDGDVRPQGSNPDIGADEVVP